MPPTHDNFKGLLGSCNAAELLFPFTTGMEVIILSWHLQGLFWGRRWLCDSLNNSSLVYVSRPNRWVEEDQGVSSVKFWVKCVMNCSIWAQMINLGC